MGRLQDKVAVITGSGDGIGYGIARRFAAEGATILVAERDAATGQAAADTLAKEFGVAAEFVRTDVGVKDDVLAMIDHARDAWGTVDILVNNAWGGGTISRVEKKTDDDLAHGFSIGVYGPFWAMQAAFPLMKAQGWGRVVNLCSLNGVNAHMGSLEYNCAKEALRTLTRTAAREWAPTGVTVNAICPAAKSATFKKVMAEHPELVASADAANPMGRMGDPEEDIAPVALFLASEDCRYITGNTLYADGGAHINGSSWAPDLGE
jgi:NAD(P)-dependent dehydrogenase (short-subunit alcohol dehydrogenase family)